MMKKLILFITCLFLAFLLWLPFFSCTSSAVLAEETLSAVEYFQKAYEASDNKNYKLAIRYYEDFREKYPEETERNLWAEYEIAFTYYKMGNLEQAATLIDQLLAKYAGEGAEAYPPAPKALAEKVKEKIKS